MTWLRMDDDFYDHEKIGDLDPAAGWLWVRSLGWSAKHLRDGFVPSHVVVKFAGDIDTASRLAGLLVAATLWTVAPGGWVAHDFTDYNPSAEQVRAKRAAAQQRMSVARAQGKTVRANIDASSHEQRANESRTTRERSREHSQNASGNTSARSPVPSRPNPNVSSAEDTPPYPPPGGVACATEERVGLDPLQALSDLRERSKGRVNAAADSRSMAAWSTLVRDLATQPGSSATSLTAYQTLGDWIAAGGLGWMTRAKPSLAWLLSAGRLAEQLEAAAEWDRASRPPIVHQNASQTPPRASSAAPALRPRRLGPAPCSTPAEFDADASAPDPLFALLEGTPS